MGEVGLKRPDLKNHVGVTCSDYAREAVLAVFPECSTVYAPGRGRLAARMAC